MISKERLKESVIAFYFCGMLAACTLLGLAGNNLALRSCIFAISFLGYCIYWWRLQFLNEREREGFSQKHE